MSIEIRNLNKSFGEKQVLKDVNLTLQDDSVYCLMGQSGTGKTTLFRILMGLETADSGSITGMKSDSVSVMFQENRLCESLTPVQNVGLVSFVGIRRSAIRENLKRILPEDCLDQPCSELSGGMKRRVSLARALNYYGSLIIMDEPFTGLDEQTKKEVIEYIKEMRRKRILLISTHSEDDVELLGAEKILLSDINHL